MAAVVCRRNRAPKRAAMRNASAAPAKSSRTTPGGNTNQTSVAGEQGIDAADTGKASIEHQFRALLDFVHIVAATAGGVDHRESQGCLGDEIDIKTEVGSDARGGFATLFGADAGHDDTANAVLAQPAFQTGIGERVVRALAEGHRHIRRHPFERTHQARRRAERAIVVFLVQDAHPRPAASRGSLQHPQHGSAECGDVIFAPIRGAQKGLLDVDGEYRGIGRHGQTPSDREASLWAAGPPPASTNPDRMRTDRAKHADLRNPGSGFAPGRGGAMVAAWFPRETATWP